MRRVLLVVFLALMLLPTVLANGGEDRGENEAEFGGLASLGVALIFVGTAYYALTKRRLVIRHIKGDEISIRFERPYITVIGPVYPMTIHHAFTVTGTILTLIHFSTCTDYSTLAGKAGLGMALLLVALNISGFYGRYVHAKVERAARERDSEMLKRLAVLLRRWKHVHVALSLLFLVLLAVHGAAVD